MENVTLDTCEFHKLLPLWMRDDATDKSLSESIDHIVAELLTEIKKLSIWNQIDTMTEAELDEMAKEFKVSWYRYSSPIIQKRKIIKEARKVHRKLGTKWAIEYVLNIYFASATVKEWYEYDGTPGHFKIETYNSATINEQAEEFSKILDNVKRTGQILDQIEVIATSEADIIQIIVPHIATTSTTQIIY